MNSRILPVILGALLALVAVRYAGRECIDSVLGSVAPTVKPITAQTQPRVIYSASNPQPASIVQPQVEHPTPVGQYPDCKEAQAGQACINSEGEQVITMEAPTALALWEEMRDQAVESDIRAPATTPTAEVPTECERLSELTGDAQRRATASCELIKRGLLHPKG